jgi:hypothetical protein
MWKQFHGCPTSGDGIVRVLFQLENNMTQWSREKKMDKTLENTLKTSINTKLTACDDKGVFTDDDDTYRKHK